MRITLFIVLVLFVACKGGEDSKPGVALDELEWLIGKWQKEQSNIYEMWSKKENHFYGGLVVSIDSLEGTEIREVMSLESKKDGIYLSAKVTGQNNEKKIEFKMSNSNFDSPKFSNNDHDYPNHINYLKIGSNKIKVEISGNNGQSSSFYFNREI